MIPRVISRRVRPLWIAALASAAWVIGKDLPRWAEFLRRAVTHRKSRPLSELITEARVRAAVTSDPLLRRDPELEDIAVRDGVVTLLTRTSAWPDSGNHVQRLTRVQAIADVPAGAV